MATVELKNVCKDFGRVRAVSDVSLSLQKGEFVVFVGPSGCGKSTLLRMVAGLEDISKGALLIDGKDMTHTLPAQRGVAMVFQSYALYPHMSVYENMAFGLEQAKLKKPEIRQRVTHAAKMLQIEQLLDRKPRALSGGQRQRVAIGRAMVRSPSVFLFDEPLSNLDAKLRAEMRAQIKRLHKQLGVTSVYVTHDQLEAMTLADKIVCLKDGYVAQAGTPHELYRKPRTTFVAEFIGSPAMNLIPADLVQDGATKQISIAGQSIVAPPEVEGRAPGPIILGLRPEHVSDTALPGGQTLDVDVDLLEPIGSEILLTTQLGVHSFTIRCEDHGQFVSGAALKAHFSTENLHCFDPETGLRLDAEAREVAA